MALCTENPECLQESNPAAASSSSLPRRTSIRITRLMLFGDAKAVIGEVVADLKGGTSIH